MEPWKGTAWRGDGHIWHHGPGCKEQPNPTRGPGQRSLREPGNATLISVDNGESEVKGVFCEQTPPVPSSHSPPRPPLPCLLWALERLEVSSLGVGSAGYQPEGQRQASRPADWPASRCHVACQGHPACRSFLTDTPKLLLDPSPPVPGCLTKICCRTSLIFSLPYTHTHAHHNNNLATVPEALPHIRSTHSTSSLSPLAPRTRPHRALRT